MSSKDAPRQAYTIKRATRALFSQWGFVGRTALTRTVRLVRPLDWHIQQLDFLGPGTFTCLYLLGGTSK